jgi:hypothetical protein
MNVNKNVFLNFFVVEINFELKKLILKWIIN